MGLPADRLEKKYSHAVTNLENYSRFGMKPGLDRIRRLMVGLGNPQNNLKVILVGGTNGKGSVCAYLSNILSCAGYQVGLYTSPHLVDYTERIKINGRDISKLAFARLFARVKAAIVSDADPPTVFEILTAMAILSFAEKKVDWVVCEVGLGGSFDATNILNPVFSIITNVEHDHTEVLGKTLQKIAKDKAGIIRPHAYLITGESKPAVLKVLKKTCEKQQAKLMVVGAGGGLTMRPAKLPLVKFCRGKRWQPFIAKSFQKNNLALVSAAVKLFNQLGGKIRARNIKLGIAKTRWPARFQVLFGKPLIILDGAHNPAGIMHLKKTLQQLAFPRPAALIFGAIKGKDVRQMLPPLLLDFDQVMITSFQHPGALPPRAVLAAINYLVDHQKKIRMFSSPLSALQNAIRAGNQLIVICGSLYMAGELQRANLSRLTAESQI